MFPHFYKGADVEAQRRYCDLAFPAADLVICSSRTVAADVRAPIATPAGSPMALPPCVPWGKRQHLGRRTGAIARGP